LEDCTNLMTLYLRYCESLQNVDALQGLTNLTDLDLRYCTLLQNIDRLEGCTNLTSLNLFGCSSLPPELQKYFATDSSGTAYEQFMKALNTSKGNRP